MNTDSTTKDGSRLKIRVYAGAFLDESGVVNDDRVVQMATAVAFEDPKAGLVLTDFFMMSDELIAEQSAKQGPPSRATAEQQQNILGISTMWNVRRFVENPIAVYLCRWWDGNLAVAVDNDPDQAVNKFSLEDYTVLGKDQAISMVVTNEREARIAAKLNEWTGRTIVSPDIVQSEIAEKVKVAEEEAAELKAKLEAEKAARKAKLQEQAEAAKKAKAEKQAAKAARKAQEGPNGVSGGKDTKKDGKGRSWRSDAFGPKLGQAEFQIKLKTGKLIRLSLAEFAELKGMI